MMKVINPSALKFQDSATSWANFRWNISQAAYALSLR